jgi:hypothetical protein
MVISQARIVRGFARHKKDFDRLRAAGIKAGAIFRADEGEAIGKFPLKGDEDLIVCDGFRALGKGGEEIESAIETVHGTGARVVDLATGRNSRDHGHKLMREALEAYKPPPEAAANARAAKAPVVRDNKSEALAIWHDRYDGRTRSVKQKLKMLKPWGYTRYWLYSDEGIKEGFGKTVRAGRIPNSMKKT